MLQKQSILLRCDNSRWLRLKIFHIYKHGAGLCGRVSFFSVAAIKKRRYINPNKKRRQIAHKAFNCILVTRARTLWTDGQVVTAKYNRAAAFTRRIRRSRMKIRSTIFYNTRRRKYLQLARALV